MSHTPTRSYSFLPHQRLGLDLGWRLYPAYGSWRTHTDPALLSSRRPRLSRGGRWPDASGERTQTWAAGMLGRVHLDRRTARCHIDLRITPGLGWPLEGGDAGMDLTFAIKAKLAGSPTLGYTGQGMLSLGEVTDSAEIHLRPAIAYDADQHIGLEVLAGISADPRAFRLEKRRRPGDLLLALHCRFVPDSPEWEQAA